MHLVNGQATRRLSTHFLKSGSPDLTSISFCSTFFTSACLGPMFKNCTNLSRELWSPCASPTTLPSSAFLTQPVTLSLLASLVVVSLLECQAANIGTLRKRQWTDIPEEYTLNHAFNFEADLRDGQIAILVRAIRNCSHASTS